MKILFFIETLRAGGKERRLLELLKYLDNNTNYEIVLVLMANKIEYNLDINFKIYILGKKYKRDFVKIFFKLYKILNIERPNIVNVWGILPSLLTIFLKNIYKFKLVNSNITNAYPNLHIFNPHYFLNKISFYFSDLILSNSVAGKNVYKPKNNITKIIYNGLSIERMIVKDNQEKIKNKFNIKTEHNLIMVGRFDSRKDHIKLLKIFEIILKSKNNIGLILVGDGKNKSKINEYIEKHCLNNVFIIGKTDKVNELVSISDIGILFSPLGEGISNAIMEYMYLKKTVIANNLGGNNELVLNNKTGYLVDVETNEEIAELIINLLNDKEKRISMGEKGYKRIINNFSIYKMGEEFIKVFNEVLKT